jgi:hypothetical protein
MVEMEVWVVMVEMEVWVVTEEVVAAVGVGGAARQRLSVYWVPFRSIASFLR